MPSTEVAEIRLVSGERVILDRADLPLVEGRKWYRKRGGRGTLYARAYSGRRNGKTTHVTMHRVLLGITGRENATIGVDHINSNGLDNRRSNLRTCTQAENSRNRRSGENQRLPKGVAQAQGYSGFIAKITANRKQIYLGTFATPVLAAIAYDGAARALHGKFARLNYPTAEHQAQAMRAYEATQQQPREAIQ